MIKANNPALQSWVESAAGSDFPIQNIPFGILKPDNQEPRIATAIGDKVVDLAVLADIGYFNEIDFDKSVLYNEFLNDFIALGKDVTRTVRDHLSDLLNAENLKLQEDEYAKSLAFVDMKDANLLLPVRVGDYTDFYSSIEHATNIGCLFRDPENALLPNWRHLPVGYHGRASSIVVSGTPVHRPKGQQIPANSKQPVFGPCKLLDFELEMGFVIGKGNDLGDNVSTKDAEDFIFGLILFNDWSARDIQKWEYVPLGPFLGKSFASTVSPWIVTLDALEPYRVAGPVQEPAVLPYLQYEGKKNYDIKLEVAIQPENVEETVVSRSNFKYMYWNMAQQLAHHTINGCNVRVGDLCASGTISGPTQDSLGSMLEISWKGSRSVIMADGTERKFIKDHDTVIMRGFCENDGIRIGFGDVTGKILPAK